jgi:hypothetical protein
MASEQQLLHQAAAAAAGHHLHIHFFQEPPPQAPSAAADEEICIKETTWYLISTNLPRKLELICLVCSTTEQLGDEMNFYRTERIFGNPFFILRRDIIVSALLAVYCSFFLANYYMTAISFACNTLSYHQFYSLIS